MTLSLEQCIYCVDKWRTVACAVKTARHLRRCSIIIQSCGQCMQEDALQLSDGAQSHLWQGLVLVRFQCGQSWL